jgi:hypothetical protein
MDPQTDILEAIPVDRTPYSAFSWVVASAVLLTGGMTWGVWRAGSWVKEQRWSLGKTELPSGSIDTTAIDEARKRAADSVTTAANQAAEAAASAAADAASKAVTDKLESTLGN